MSDVTSLAPPYFVPKPIFFVVAQARIVIEEASDAPYPVVMVPLEVTHTALATDQVLDRIRAMRTPFSEMVVDLLTFFKDTYEEVFNFRDGPPVHDACAVAYVSRSVVPCEHEGRGVRPELLKNCLHFTSFCTLLHPGLIYSGCNTCAWTL